jgi:hypothetical protein
VEKMNPIHASSHIQLDCLPGLVERHLTVLDCVRASIYSQPKPLKSIAMDMDMSQSDLSRKLSSNPDDPRRFSVVDLENYIKTTGDTTPILYMVQKYCTDHEASKREAIALLASMVPQIQSLLAAAGVGKGE